MDTGHAACDDLFPDVPASMDDRLSQLQNGIDALVSIMHTTLDYLSHKSTFRQLDAAYPITQSNPAADEPAVFDAQRKQLMTMLLKKAKQVEYLCSVAPAPAPREADYSDLSPLEGELQAANRDYLAALADAERLQAELQDLYRLLLDRRPS